MHESYQQQYFESLSHAESKKNIVKLNLDVLIATGNISLDFVERHKLVVFGQCIFENIVLLTYT